MKDRPSSLPTSAEITNRLRIVSELRNLCLSLGRARCVGVIPDPSEGKLRPDLTVDARSNALQTKAD